VLSASADPNAVTSCTASADTVRIEPVRMRRRNGPGREALVDISTSVPPLARDWHQQKGRVPSLVVPSSIGTLVFMSTEKRFVFRPITGLIIVAVFVCVGIAVIYLTTAADNLPSFFPGHAAHSVHKHTKHGVAFLGVAAIGLVLAWFSTSPTGSTP
jgi:hypothetical protein